MSDWQSIETAPKDGYEMLAYSPTQGVCFVEWHKNIAEWKLTAGRSYVMEQVGSGGDIHYSVLSDPTHWMPVPDPPTEQPDER